MNCACNKKSPLHLGAEKPQSEIFGISIEGHPLPLSFLNVNQADELSNGVFHKSAPSDSVS